MEPNEEKNTPADSSMMSPEQLRSDMDTIKTVLTESDKNRDIHRIIIAAAISSADC